MTEVYEFRHRHALAGTAETGAAERSAQLAPQVEQPPPSRLGSPRDLAKFTGLVALFAIFTDAAVGHALLWENDPYWTYWITKTFLIATVFGLGTAWLGMGVGRGAAITAVHTVVLTVYYWSLSPIGLPSHPEWLDLEHTWVTGLPVHFGVIYLGYLGALWLWRRRERVRPEASGSDPSQLASYAGAALAVGGGIALVGGGLVSVAIDDFPGVTWFLVRLLIAVPFVIGWWAYAGRDRVAAVAGGLTLAFVYGTYGHYLGPVGLPDLPLRIASEAPPEASAAWLSYREEWLTAFPIVVVVAVTGFLLASRRDEQQRSRNPLLPAAVGAAVLAAALGAYAFVENEPAGDVARVAAEGTAAVERGVLYGGDFAEATASVTLEAQERSPRVSPLPPHDKVDLVARVDHPDGRSYQVVADRPMVDDPLGRHGTWWGVGLHRWHHGDSGIGTRELPALRSEVAVFAVGKVVADGEALASGVPVHLMTMTDDEDLPGRLELNVGDEDTPIAGLPDGHLRVVWQDYEGGAPQGPKRARNVFGSGVLLGLLALALLAVRREEAPVS